MSADATTEPDLATAPEPDGTPGTNTFVHELLRGLREIHVKQNQLLRAMLDEMRGLREDIAVEREQRKLRNANGHG